MRSPADVPEEGNCGPDVRAGLDSDRDGRPDSIFTSDGDDLLLHTDMDADGLADRSLRLRADGSVTPGVTDQECTDPPSLVDALLRWLHLR